MQSPHDTLFGFTFRHAHHAAGWMRSVLPTGLAAAIDWHHLTPLRERFPDARLRPHLTDSGFCTLVLSANEQRDLCLLPEHKSYDDPGTTDHVLRYTIHVQRTLQAELGRPPLVLPILLRHGFATRSPGSPEDPVLDQLLAAQPRQRLFVDDLDQHTEEAIASRDMTPLARLTLLCLKVLRHADPDDVPRFFDRWQHLLQAIDRTDGAPEAPPLGPDAVDAIGWYALAVTNVDSLALSETFCRILHRDETNIMSTLDKARQQGVSQGLTQGISQGLSRGKAEALLRLLHRRFGQPDNETMTRIRSATPEQLDIWLDRVLDAATLDELLRD